MLLLFSDYLEPGQRLAAELQLDTALVDIHRFPDGESKLTLPSPLPDEVFVCRSLDRPNDKLIELMLLAQTARAMGVKRLTLIAPYMCYLRQDIAFHAGEAISAHIVGRFLAGLFDRIVTVDPHLHRIPELEQAMPGIEAMALGSAGMMREFLAANTTRPLLVGPDAESEQWVRAIAEPAGYDYAVASKERLGDRQVRVHLPDHDYHQHEVVLVDDMISTGRTLIGVAEQLKRQGAETIHCLVTHALFSDDVTEALRAAGIEQIWSSDAIAHPSNALPLAPLLASALSTTPRS